MRVHYFLSASCNLSVLNNSSYFLVEVLKVYCILRVVTIFYMSKNNTQRKA